MPGNHGLLLLCCQLCSGAEGTQRLLMRLLSLIQRPGPVLNLAQINTSDLRAMAKAKALLLALSHPPWLSIWFQNLPLPSWGAAHPSSTGSDGAVTPSVSMRSHTHRCCASVRAQRVPQLETLLLEGQFKVTIRDFMIP